MPGHNGGFNPYRDSNGEFTNPGGHGGKGRSRKGGVGAAPAPNRGPRAETYRAGTAARAIPANAKFQPPPKGRKQTAEALSQIAGEDSSKRDAALRALRGVSPGRAVGGARSQAALEANQLKTVAKANGMTVAQLKKSMERPPDTRTKAQVKRDVDYANTLTYLQQQRDSAKTSIKLATQKGWPNMDARKAELTKAEADLAAHVAKKPKK
ncbi:hypothetical protein EKD04_009470 [Chloroflexales bacterium ZM16-3]|nr:hypothetical protein [Chloroflexales bacterium ZM16-3]